MSHFSLSPSYSHTFIRKFYYCLNHLLHPAQVFLSHLYEFVQLVENDPD